MNDIKQYTEEQYERAVSLYVGVRENAKRLGAKWEEVLLVAELIFADLTLGDKDDDFNFELELFINNVRELRNFLEHGPDRWGQYN
ncbi:MAG: hypothetical protein QXP58_07780 [Thermoprotei archaeon]